MFECSVEMRYSRPGYVREGRERVTTVWRVNATLVLETGRRGKEAVYLVGLSPWPFGPRNQGKIENLRGVLKDELRARYPGVEFEFRALFDSVVSLTERQVAL